MNDCLQSDRLGMMKLAARSAGGASQLVQSADWIRRLPGVVCVRVVAGDQLEILFDQPATDVLGQIQHRLREGAGADAC
jgi:hypothetical protein